MVLRVLIAAVLGGAVGYDRQRHDKPAGLRTHMLVAMGSALFVGSGVLLLLADASGPDTRLDLLRVSAAVATGIGFLGAGAIIRSGATVRGLTTAAGIWVTAGIGATVGVGQYYLAVGATLITVIVIAVLGHARVPRPGGRTPDDEV